MIARSKNKISLKYKSPLRAKDKVKAKVVVSSLLKTSYHIIAGKSITNSKFPQSQKKEVTQFGIVLTILKISLIKLNNMDMIFPTLTNTIGRKCRTKKIQ